MVCGPGAIVAARQQFCLRRKAGKAVKVVLGRTHNWKELYSGHSQQQQAACKPVR